jgi:hypothetical protein
MRLPEKLAGLARGAVLYLRRRPAVAAGLIAGVICLLLPAVLGRDYRLLAQREPYHLMWLNLLGAHYKLPLETPKPLHVLLAGLLGSGPAFYAVTCAMVGLCVAAATRLGRIVTGSVWPGLVAVATVFALRGQFVHELLLGGTEPFHVALVLLALVAVAGGRLRLASLVIFVACLCRPEAWLLAPIPLLLMVVDKRRFSVLSLLPFAAPLIWAGFDRAMTGDWLYSLHLTSYYRLASPRIASPTGSLWGDMLFGLAGVAGVVPSVVGLAGLGIWSWQLARCRNPVRTGDTETSRRGDIGTPRVAAPLFFLPWVVWLTLVLPLVASWLASLSGHVLQMGRFQSPSAVLLALFAASCPFLLLGRRAPRWLPLALAAGVAACAFSPGQVRDSLERARIDEMRATIYNPIAGDVKQLVDNGSAEIAIVSARELDYFARLLGPANSWRLLSIREVMFGARAIPARARSAVLAYIEPDEITDPSADSVVHWVTRAWPTRSVLVPYAVFGSGHGGVWLIKSVRQ